MGGMTQFAGQEKVGGAWASEVAKCMQYPLTQNKLYNSNTNSKVMQTQKQCKIQKQFKISPNNQWNLSYQSIQILAIISRTNQYCTFIFIFSIQF